MPKNRALAPAPSPFSSTKRLSLRDLLGGVSVDHRELVLDGGAPRSWPPRLWRRRHPRWDHSPREWTITPREWNHHSSGANHHPQVRILPRSGTIILRRRTHHLQEVEPSPGGDLPLRSGHPPQGWILTWRSRPITWGCAGALRRPQCRPVTRFLGHRGNGAEAPHRRNETDRSERCNELVFSCSGLFQVREPARANADVRVSPVGPGSVSSRSRRVRTANVPSVGMSS